MNRTRTKLNNSKDISQAYHLVHSFDKKSSKELDIDKMHQIAVEFAEKYFPNGQILVASHNDKDHFHSHLVINNIDLETCKRIRIDPKDLQKMRNLNDEILTENDIKPIDNNYYDNLEKKKNIYSNDSKKLKEGQLNYQEFIQTSIETVLSNREINTLDKFSDCLAQKFNIEVYHYSKNSNKIGYVLYKDDVNFFDQKDKFVELGKNKQSRKQREKYVEKTFSAKKLGRKFSLERIEEQLNSNLYENYLSNIDKLSKDQICAIASGFNLEGKLNKPFVELDKVAQIQFKDYPVDNNFVPYDDFLELVDRHFKRTIYLEDDNEYELTLHFSVNPKTLKSNKSKKILIKKTDEKDLFISKNGFQKTPHTPCSKKLHHQINKTLNDDIKIYRAKKDYEFTQKMIENQQNRSQRFDIEI